MIKAEEEEASPSDTPHLATDKSKRKHRITEKHMPAIHIKTVDKWVLKLFDQMI